MKIFKGFYATHVLRACALGNVSQLGGCYLNLVRAMATVPINPLRWSLSFFSAWLLLPFAPALLVMLVGFALPGVIPWSIVEVSFPVASVAALVVCGFLLWRGPGPLVLRIIGTVVVAVVLGFVARTEVVMQAGCGPQRGQFIDFQHQFHESKTVGVPCG